MTGPHGIEPWSPGSVPDQLHQAGEQGARVVVPVLGQHVGDLPAGGRSTAGWLSTRSSTLLGRRHALGRVDQDGDPVLGLARAPQRQVDAERRVPDAARRPRSPRPAAPLRAARHRAGPDGGAGRVAEPAGRAGQPAVGAGPRQSGQQRRRPRRRPGTPRRA